MIRTIRRLGGAGIAAMAIAGTLAAPAAADPSADEKRACAGASEQGESQRDEGKYRAARKSFTTCARHVCPTVIAQSCTKWLSELEDSAPTVVVVAKDEQGNDLTETTITLDGEPFAAAPDGRAVEMDTGYHTFRFERAGRKPVETKVLLHAGEKARVISAVLASLDATGPAAAPPPRVGKPPAAERPSEPASEPLMSPRHVVAGALALGAVAAGGLGAFFLVQSTRDADLAAKMRAGAPSNECTHSTSTMCQTLSDTVDSQRHESVAATALFVGAGALMAGAVVTWLFGRAPKASTQAVGWITPTPGGATVHLGARFR